MPYTNLDYLREFTDNDPNLLKEAVQRYLNKSPVLLEELNKGYEDKDWEKVSFAAHTLFSATQIVGIESIKSELRQIETLARNGEDHHEIEKNLQHVNKAIKGSFKELNQL